MDWTIGYRRRVAAHASVWRAVFTFIHLIADISNNFIEVHIISKSTIYLQISTIQLQISANTVYLQIYPIEL